MVKVFCYTSRIKIVQTAKNIAGLCRLEHKFSAVSSARPDHVRVEGWPVTRDMFSFNRRTYMSWEVWQIVLLSGGMHFVRFFSHTESNLLLFRAFGWSNNDRRCSKLIILFIKSRTLYVFLYVQIKTVKDRTLSELITIKVDPWIRSWPNSL